MAQNSIYMYRVACEWLERNSHFQNELGKSKPCIAVKKFARSDGVFTVCNDVKASGNTPSAVKSCASASTSLSDPDWGAADAASMPASPAPTAAADAFPSTMVFRFNVFGITGKHQGQARQLSNG